MASTLRKEQNLHARALDPDITTLDRGATLGSEGSTAGSESSALDTSPPEYIDITIVLPNGKTQTLTVEYSKQMLDLLVQVTAAVPHLSPTTHTFQALQSGRPVDYQASQPVGTLGVSTLHIVEKPHAKKKHRPAPNQPFEMTQRVTVNLTRQQKMVLRLSPDSPLCEVFRLACQEKGFDPYKYELRHPSQPNTELNMALSLVHYQLSEITLVNIGSDAGSGGRSSTLSLGRSVLNGSHAEQSRDCHTMEKKKKKGLFAVFRKKDKFKPGEARYSGSTSQLPTSSAEAASWSKSPSRGAEGWGKSPSRGAEATKPNYTLHSKSTTSLHSSGADTLQSHPQSRQSHTESRQSHNESRQSHNESRVSHASSSRGGVEESKGQPPPKPPRGGGGKKRQAPPPPPQPASQTTSQRARASQPASQQSPAQVSPTTSSQDSGLVPSEGSHPRPTHSRTSSRSSGFDSAASPLGDSTGLSSDVTGSGARPKTMLKVSTGQKVTNRSKKRHAPPPPPGVSRLRTDSDLASVDSSTSTPRDTPRDQQEVTGESHADMVDALFDFGEEVEEDYEDDDDGVENDDIVNDEEKGEEEGEERYRDYISDNEVHVLNVLNTNGYATQYDRDLVNYVEHTNDELDDNTIKNGGEEGKLGVDSFSVGYDESEVGGGIGREQLGGVSEVVERVPSLSVKVENGKIENGRNNLSDVDNGEDLDKNNNDDDGDFDGRLDNGVEYIDEQDPTLINSEINNSLSEDNDFEQNPSQIDSAIQVQNSTDPGNFVNKKEPIPNLAALLKNSAKILRPNSGRKNVKTTVIYSSLEPTGGAGKMVGT